MQMYKLAEIINQHEAGADTWIFLKIPGEHLAEEMERKQIQSLEIRLEDGRSITGAQRRKAYAMLKDIADYTGYLPEECKQLMKWDYMAETGSGEFSLSDCSVDRARDFIDWLLETAIREGIPLSEAAIERAEDIGRYLYACLKNKRCAVCGRPGEVHHVDAIGMGRDRRRVDDSRHRKLCLCREHHTIAHQRGMPAFERMYHVYGIVITPETE